MNENLAGRNETENKELNQQLGENQPLNQDMAEKNEVKTDGTWKWILGGGVLFIASSTTGICAVIFRIKKKKSNHTSNIAEVNIEMSHLSSVNK